MAKILVVEDDVTIAKTLILALKARKFETLHANNGVVAISLAAQKHPDLILLDLGLPDIDGMQVIKDVRKWSQVPIIVVSARYQSQGKVEALDLGADDYVTKPFAMDELLARLRAALRRHDSVKKTEQALIATNDGRMTIDLAHQKVCCEGKIVKLTRTEWQMLEVFANNIDRLIPSKEMLESVWGAQYSKESTYLRVYISNLRHKLEAHPTEPQYFHTELGLGYRFTL